MEEANRRIQEWQQNGDINQILDLYGLNLTELPVLPRNLQKLKCSGNQLENLSNLPNTLQELYFGDNQLENFPDLLHLINLRILYCNNNQLEDLPNLSELINLQILNCGVNQITSLPHLPNSLQKLDCYDNQLTELPNLSRLINLQTLSCGNNQLNELPVLPNSLQKLDCDDNQLRSLPDLPNTLQELYCHNNQLRSLPTLPNSLQTLDCSENQLTNLPPLSHLINLTEISYNDNPNLVLTPEQTEFIRNLPIDEELEEDEDEESNDTEDEPEDEPMDEETPDQLETRTNLAHTRMNQITTQNTALIESTFANTTDDQKLNDLHLPELDAKEQAVYKSRCSNTNDLIGDDLDVRYGDVVIIDTSNPDKYISYCFTYPEADAMWDYAKTYNVHAYLGYKIDQRGTLLSKLYNTLILRRIDGLKYTLDPIPRKVFIDEEKITQTTINNFQPTLEDINQYYLNGKDDEFGGNIRMKSIRKIEGKFGTIEIDGDIIKNIIKISDSIKYEINGNNVRRI
jgi:Leucine-rich repeat (LRR) protein